MPDFKTYLDELHTSLNSLKAREAKQGGELPIEHLEQINVLEHAIVLTEQVIRGELSEDEWQEELKSLQVSLEEARVTFDQRNQRVGTQLNIAGDLKIYLLQPPELLDPEMLTDAEKRYRQHIKARYAEDASYYIPLAGETTEPAPLQAEIQAPRSDRRRRERAAAGRSTTIRTTLAVRTVTGTTTTGFV
jgi:hypothetical protein